ncbi:MAG: GGDEF domain-containing protein [Bacilli bacterium]|nr:GGDEF domain-containing protein [Bacilli bacterium]
MKKNNKTNKIIILAIIGLIMTISIVIFVLNYTKDDTSFSILEKSWLNNNSNKVMDVSIYNDVPIYGENGEGISFSFLEEFTNAYGVDFNKVSYNYNSSSNLKDFSFRVLNYDKPLGDNDIHVYNDYYVIVSNNNNKFDEISDMADIKLGVFNDDITQVKYFLNDNADITYVACTDIKNMLDMLKNKKIDYMAVPRNIYLEEFISNDLNIVYHISELYKKYVITIKDNTFRSIMKKYLMIYNDTYYDTKYKTYFLNSFFKYKKLTEADRMSYNEASYTYGYSINMPFENTVNQEFVGILSNYLSGFEEMADVDFRIVEYANVKDLKQALSHGEIDLCFANFDPTGVNVDLLETVSPFKEEYLVLSRDSYVVNSVRSLKNKIVYLVANTYYHKYLNDNGITVKAFYNTDELLRGITNDATVLVDKSTYEYYKNTKFKDFKVNYTGVLDNQYRFLVRDVNKNTTFYKIFDYYVSYVNYKDIMHEYNTDYMVNSKNQMTSMLKYLLILFTFLLLLTIIAFIMYKRNNKKKDISKENKLKFIDVMTSLKNRNYLNYNIKKWDDNVIYPQAIVIIDLNNVKYINDNYGHEEGDNVIKEAANILLNSQLENTDIMRTDGNEFLVYMVGYDEKAVQDYTRNVNQLLKELPHNFGATFGYSMITDDIKTIDDAINEATLSMRQAKERL